MCSKQNRRFKSNHIQHYYRKNESKTLAKHISFECKSKFEGKKWWNNDKCQCERKKHYILKKIIFRI